MVAFVHSLNVVTRKKKEHSQSFQGHEMEVKTENRKK
jgi:hypothetical protein